MDPDEIDKQVAGGSAARLGPPPQDAPPRSRAFNVLFWISLTALVVATVRWWAA